MTPCVRLWNLFLFIILALPASLRADEPSQVSTRALVGEGKTLPKGVMRMRLPVRSSVGEKGFSANSKREDTGFKLNALSGAAVVEYGFSDAISLQFVAPAVFRNRKSLDGQQFQRSSLFKQKYDELVAVVADKLVSDGLCGTQSVCVDAINNSGLALPVNTTLTLPSGETLPVRAGVPLRDVASALLTRAVIPESGRTGMGDFEIGALFAIADREHGLKAKDWPVNVSLGVGLRFPTGAFTDVPAAQRPIGRGTVDLGLRANMDWYLHPTTVFSAQLQLESMLRAGLKKRSSLLNSSALNTADPNSAGADGVDNTARYERSGFRPVGFLKAASSFAEVSEAVRALSANVLFKYDLESKTMLAGKTFSEESALYAVQTGLSFDGLVHALPGQVDVDYEIPLAGKNRSIAPFGLTLTLKLFHRFN